MKISSVGHAAILVETRGIRILSDPWWQAPCFGTQWWLHPAPYLSPLEAAPPDFIYISHGHSDHLHPGTMQRLPKSAKVVVSNAVDVETAIAKLGFEVIALAPGEVREIAPGVKIEIMPTCGGDSLLVIDDGMEVCINLNDALLAVPATMRDQTIRSLRERYGRADYVYCGYGSASYFPNCFDIPGKNHVATACKRQNHFNDVWGTIVSKLDPHTAFPFAANVVFFEKELFGLNEVIHNTERPTAKFKSRFPSSGTRVFDAAPGFVIENKSVVTETLFEPVSNARLNAYVEKISIANDVSTCNAEQIEALAKLVKRNIELCSDHLLDFQGNYRFLIALKAAPMGIEIAKHGRSITASLIPEPANRSNYDLVFSTRFSYLRRALTTPYGHEVIFVGSGGTWSYRDRAMIRFNLHRELSVLLHKVEGMKDGHRPTQPRWILKTKQWVKNILGYEKPHNLYDLNAWVVFDSQSSGEKTKVKSSQAQREHELA